MLTTLRSLRRRCPSLAGYVAGTGLGARRSPPEGASVGYALAPVPEPSTVVLSLTALVFMGTMYFRRHRKGAVKSFALGKRTDPVLPDNRDAKPLTGDSSWDRGPTRPHISPAGGQYAV